MFADDVKFAISVKCAEDWVYCRLMLTAFSLVDRKIAWRWILINIQWCHSSKVSFCTISATCRLSIHTWFGFNTKFNFNDHIFDICNTRWKCLGFIKQQCKLFDQSNAICDIYYNWNKSWNQNQTSLLFLCKKITDIGDSITYPTTFIINTSGGKAKVGTS